MRLSDIKKPKKITNERLADYVGSSGAAQLKQFANKFLPGGDRREGMLSAGDKARKEEFISNFISAAYRSLNAEIDSGRVDPSLKSEPGGSTQEPPKPAQPPATEPAAPAATNATPKVAPGNAKAPGVGQRQTSQNINNYVRGIATSLNAEPDKAKKMALAKELVNFMADRKDYPEWQNALASAQQIIKKGIADPNFANSAINRLKAGQMMEAWQVYWINKLLESIGFTFKDLGLTLLKENKRNGNYILAETKFYKLNMIFEGMLTEAESVEQWIKRWVPAYTKVPVNNTYLQSLMKAAADSFDTKNIKPFNAALEKLATGLFADAEAPGIGGGQETTSGAGGQQKPTAPAATEPAQPQKTGTSTDTIVNSIQSLLSKLKGIDPALHADIVKKIGAGQSLQGLPGGGSKPAATPAAPVSESKRKIRK
jgi:hypothetical protein